MAREVGPGGGIPQEAQLPLGIVSEILVPAAIGAYLWVAGNLVARMTSLKRVPLDSDFYRTFLSGGPAEVWRGISVVLFWVVAVGLALMVLVPAWYLWGKW